MIDTLFLILLVCVTAFLPVLMAMMVLLMLKAWRDG